MAYHPAGRSGRLPLAPFLERISNGRWQHYHPFDAIAHGLYRIIILLMQSCYGSDATRQSCRPRPVVHAIVELYLSQVSASRVRFGYDPQRAWATLSSF